jgi:hypothetical protein
MIWNCFKFFVVYTLVGQGIAASGGALMWLVSGTFQPWVGYAIGSIIITTGYSIYVFVDEMRQG